MKVLTITNMWPYSKKTFYGIFVKEQVDALSKYYPELDNRIWFIKGYISKLNYIVSIFQLNWHLFFHKYDIIHIHSALSGIFLLFAPLRKNVVITLHGTEILDPSQYRVSKHVVKKVKNVICVSDEIECIVKKNNPNIKTHIVPCAVRDDFFVDKRRKKDNIVRIIFPSAQWRKVKNYPLFMEIITLIRTTCSNEIEIIELDNKTREEIFTDLNDADLLLMTSLHEGSPQIIKEAMCCNTPIISSKVGTVKYMLEGVTNSTVIDNYNASDYVDAIQRLLQLSITEFPIRSNGRKRIFELKYDEKSIAAQIRDIYNDIVLH